MSERPIVSVEWLKAHLDEDSVCIVDASWHLPPEKRDPHAEYLQTHIPGAVFFDIDAISTPSDLPHMLPSAEIFEKSVGQLGLVKDKTVVVYDTKGLFSAARVWWTLSVFGFSDVKILDGGLPAWQEKGFAVETGPVSVSSVGVESTLTKSAVVDADQVLRASESGDVQIIDARAQGRFDGLAPEPREGLRAGHIPGSVCLPYVSLLAEGRLKSDAELREIFSAHGLLEDKPIYTTCGSGVTAAILTLALHCIGRDDSALYDGSWTEWGGRSDLPIAIKQA